jgi:cob(I)alamin adenosyltransferase
MKVTPRYVNPIMNTLSDFMYFPMSVHNQRKKIQQAETKKSLAKRA